MAILALLVLPCGLRAEQKKTFEGGRFSVLFPDEWKKGKGPEDGNQLYFESADGKASFSAYVVDVGEGKKPDLQASLRQRVKRLSEGGLKVLGDVEGIEQEFDGKKAVFASVPTEANAQGQKIRLSFNFVFLDAKDRMVILQVILRSSASDELRAEALEVIKSFREKVAEEKD